jgi:glycosyltransferase involved in cell wall biosynthesis
MPQGVDAVYQTRPRPERSAKANRTERVGHCVAGFLGGISEVIDWDALTAAARELEEVDFVMCGPTVAPVPRGLPRNIEFRGWVTPEDAPKVMASFTVGLIPYVRNRRTDAVLPTKLTEYLAAGIRVVSSDLPDVVSLSRELGSDLVWIYDDHATLIEGIRELIRMEPVSEDVRSAIYERYSWDRLVREWVAHVEEQMNSRGAKDSGQGHTPDGDVAGAAATVRRQL